MEKRSRKNIRISLKGGNKMKVTSKNYKTIEFCSLDEKGVFWYYNSLHTKITADDVVEYNTINLESHQLAWIDAHEKVVPTNVEIVEK